MNSHNIRNGGDVAFGDSLTGTLVSKPFMIDFDAIEFLVGGGAHRDLTCVNLVIDGKPVLQATGKNNNQMSLNTWDVRPFIGKEARLRWSTIINRRGATSGSTKSCFSNEQAMEWATHPLKEWSTHWRREREELRSQVQFKSHVAPAMIDGTGEDDRILIRGNSSKPEKWSHDIS